MNSFLNPINGLPFIKDYFLTVNRLKKKDINKTRNIQFKKIFNYAFNVPTYNKKYKKANISRREIKNLDDIFKLPLIDKKDIIDNFPDGILPPNSNLKGKYVVCTSGSSGKPVSLYTDFKTLSIGLIQSIRQFKHYNLNARKIKYANIGTFLNNRIDNIFERVITINTNPFRDSKNYISINAYDPIKSIIDKLNIFKPDIIYTYPITLHHLAFLKKKGFGDNINPKLLQVSGYTLSEYTRDYIEDAFNCRLVNLYQSVEASGEIAFECKYKKWHINNDFYHLEVLDTKNNIIKDYGEGHIILTRLFGKGTPIIRYSGMDDWINIQKKYNCKCGLKTPILKNGIEGRISSRIILPDGRIFPAQSFEIISLILKKFESFKIKYFQIIQEKIDKISIYIQVDENLRNIGPSMNIIYKEIKKSYEKLCGSNVKIDIKEVELIDLDYNKPVPVVISKINDSKAFSYILKSM